MICDRKERQRKLIQKIAKRDADKAFAKVRDAIRRALKGES